MAGALVIPFIALAALLGCEEHHASHSAPPGGSSAPGTPPVTARDDEWVRLKPGSFLMGSPATERCRESDETSAKVVLSHSFAVAKQEVTQHAFRQLMGYNPSFRRGCAACPVDSVTHHEASAYCNQLSMRDGLTPCYRCSGKEVATRCEPASNNLTTCRGYRLPSEAEWEYAARAGSPTASYVGGMASCMGSDQGLDGIAWYKASSLGRSHPTGEKLANSWGLYDMLGNVYEWTGDWYRHKLVGGVDPLGPKTGEERVLRGGSWYHNAEHARAANRHAFRPNKRLSYVGFRCVLPIN